MKNKKKFILILIILFLLWLSIPLIPCLIGEGREYWLLYWDGIRPNCTLIGP